MASKDCGRLKVRGRSSILECASSCRTRGSRFSMLLSWSVLIQPLLLRQSLKSINNILSKFGLLGKRPVFQLLLVWFDRVVFFVIQHWPSEEQTELAGRCMQGLSRPVFSAGRCESRSCTDKNAVAGRIACEVRGNLGACFWRSTWKSQTVSGCLV